MLLNEDERSPLKAIDFGLAASFDPEQLPRSDLGLEGTPWSVLLISSLVSHSKSLSVKGLLHTLMQCAEKKTDGLTSTLGDGGAGSWHRRCSALQWCQPQTYGLLGLWHTSC